MILLLFSLVRGKSATMTRKTKVDYPPVTIEELTEENTREMVERHSPRGVNLGNSLSEDLINQIIEGTRSLRGRVFLLKWTGNKIPRGASDDHLSQSRILSYRQQCYLVRSSANPQMNSARFFIFTKIRIHVNIISCPSVASFPQTQD